MRIKFILFMIVSVSAAVYSQSYNEYQMELLQQFPIGSDEGQLGVQRRIGYGGLPGPNSLFFSGDNLIIADTHNIRFVRLDEQWNWYETLDAGGTAPHGYFHETHEGNWVSFGLNTTMGFSHDQEPIFMVVERRNDRYFPTQTQSVFYHNDILFIHNGNQELISIESPQLSDEENRLFLNNTEQTRALFQPDSDWDPMGLSIDEQDRLFLDGELVTLDFRTFADYWYEVHDGNLEKLSALGMRMRGDDYIGRDSDGNTYWRMYRADVLVYDSEGKLIEWFLADSNKISTLPAVSPEGDVYFMDYEEDAINIYRIDRRW